MNKSETLEMLKKYYGSTRIPMQLYSENASLSMIPQTVFYPNPIAICRETLQKQQIPACYTTAFRSMLAGLVYCETTKQYILVGPALLFSCSSLQAKELLAETQQDPERLHEFLLWLNTLPVMDTEHFRHTIHFLDYLINDAASDRVRYVEDRSSLHSRPKDNEQNRLQAGEHIDIVQEDLYSAHILHLVSSGNVLELQKALHHMLKQNFGPQLISLSADRFIKNIFIGANSLVCRAAIAGGLPTPSAFALSDHYIIKIETCKTYDAVVLLLTQMMITYTSEVARMPILQSDSPLVRKITRSIKNHLYEKQTVSDIAIELNMDLSYLCRHFKQETDKTISAHIHAIKIEESKRLMESANLSLSQIAAQLGYSSQSYFHRVFKKITGMSPKSYLSSKPYISSSTSKADIVSSGSCNFSRAISEE